MRVLITGAAGFIGSHIVKQIIQEKDWEVVCVDKLSYASAGWHRLQQLDILGNARITTVTWDLEVPFSSGLIKELGDIEMIIHMAAETHVDRSIADPVDCIRNNVMSTVQLLEYARTLPQLRVFQYFSTDEVFGPAPPGVAYGEWDRHRPTNPYSASKSASEAICLGYANTYRLPVLITNLMNVFGPAQFPEKFVPLVVKKILAGEVIDVHTEGDGQTPGSRFYIHTRNVASAILFILERGTAGEKYNIPGSAEVTNLEMVQQIGAILGIEPKIHLTTCAVSRPGHDTRYCLNGAKLAAMGWTPPADFEASLRETVQWYVERPQFLQQ